MIGMYNAFEYHIEWHCNAQHVECCHALCQQAQVWMGPSNKPSIIFVAISIVEKLSFKFKLFILTDGWHSLGAHVCIYQPHPVLHERFFFFFTMKAGLWKTRVRSGVGSERAEWSGRVLFKGDWLSFSISWRRISRDCRRMKVASKELGDTKPPIIGSLGSILCYLRQSSRRLGSPANVFLMALWLGVPARLGAAGNRHCASSSELQPPRGNKIL